MSVKQSLSQGIVVTATSLTEALKVVNADPVGLEGFLSTWLYTAEPIHYSISDINNPKWYLKRIFNHLNVVPMMADSAPIEYIYSFHIDYGPAVETVNFQKYLLDRNMVPLLGADFYEVHSFKIGSVEGRRYHLGPECPQYLHGLDMMTIVPTKVKRGFIIYECYKRANRDESVYMYNNTHMNEVNTNAFKFTLNFMRGFLITFFEKVAMQQVTNNLTTLCITDSDDELATLAQGFSLDKN